MADFSLKRHDTRPSIAATLGFQGAGLPGNLTGTVEFIMCAVDSAGKPVVGAPKVRKPAVIVDAATWAVRYDWDPEDTNVSGNFLAEWERTDPGGETQTFPGNAYHSIEIFPDLDNAGSTA